MAYDYAPPKYAQVVSAIKQRIERGEYSPGTLLPSEHQLVTEFEVSRPTIVKALSALRQDGWIDTQQGKGSFVRGRPALADAERARPAHAVLEQGGGAGEPGSGVLSLEVAGGSEPGVPGLVGESIRQHLQSRKKIRLD